MRAVNEIYSTNDVLALLNKKCEVYFDRSSLSSFYECYMALVADLKKPVYTEKIVTDLLHIKRDQVNSGPYPEVSFFESANRICSDLTLLHGCIKLFNERKDINYFECCFGTKQGVDLVGYNRAKKKVLSAEVFCTSEKFFKAKFYKEKAKPGNTIIHQKLASPAIMNFIKSHREFTFISVDITQKPDKLNFIQKLK